MRNKILFIGSIIFASHVAFGDVLVTLPQPAESVSVIPVPFEQNIAAKLMDRGLEEQAAKEFALESVDDVYSATLLTEMLSNKLAISKDEIYRYIASQALFQNRVDLREHDDVVAMVQKIKGVSVMSDDLQAIETYIQAV
jgi:hypothetical protein